MRYPIGLSKIRTRQENGELLTAEPRGEIPLTDGGTDEDSNLLQHPVSNGVAVPVIDRLEMISIDIEDCTGTFFPVAQGNLFLRLHVEFVTVREAGEIIFAQSEVES